MYTLSKAKEEIDLVARHATEIAVHALAMSDAMDAKLESFKKDVLGAIDERFAELGRALHGESEASVESSAIADLGAKVSLLSQASASSPSGDGHASHSNSGPDESDGHASHSESGPDDSSDHNGHPTHEQHWGSERHSDHNHGH